MSEKIFKVKAVAIDDNGKGIVINEVNADINGDKKINISDLALLKKML